MNEFIHYNNDHMMDSRKSNNKVVPTVSGGNAGSQASWIRSLYIAAMVATIAVQVPVQAAAQMAQQGYVAPAQDLPIPSAIQFPIVFTKTIDSTQAAANDDVEAKLKEDLIVNDEVVAPADSIVVGHIEKLQQSRRLTESALSGKRRFHKGSSMKIVFDEIITPQEEHIKIVGCLSKQSTSFTEDGQPREVEIGAKGEMTKAETVFTTEQKVTSQVVGFAASTGLNTLGTAASFGALPVVMGVLGAANPDLVSPKPLRKGEKHPRLKGFAFGLWSTVPAAPVLQTVIFKGSDLRIEAEDEYLAQAHSPYDNPAPVLAISSKILTVSKDSKVKESREKETREKEAKDKQAKLEAKTPEASSKVAQEDNN